MRKFTLEVVENDEKTSTNLKADGFSKTEMLGHLITLADTLRQRIAEKNDENGGAA